MAGVLQEAGDADSRTHARSQVKVDYFNIPYTPTFIRFSHFYQEYHVHCIVVMNDGGGEGVLDLYYDVGLGTGGVYHLIVFLFVLCFCIV